MVCVVASASIVLLGVTYMRANIVLTRSLAMVYTVMPMAMSTREDGSNNLRSGHGIFRYADGRVHEGQYLNDKRPGHGVMRKADGTIIQEGRWLDGKYVGK